MAIKLSFLGAAQNVTGSRFLVEADGRRVLVDCGLYQERQFKSRDWEPFPVPPDSIDAVLVTHAHIDHCGLLPKLVREGFRGKIHCTAATSDIVRIMLLDAAKLQEEDAEFKRRRHEREGRKGPYPEVPLYTVADAEECLPLLSPARYGEPVSLDGGLVATFHDAGHVLGSSMIRLVVGRNGDERTILFSGDVGRWDKPILRDPTVFDTADYVVVESTYGDRLHEDAGTIAADLAALIVSTIEAKGNVVVPSFALERAQEVLYYLNGLLIERRIPPLVVFVDSPMAINITEVFQQHPELFDEEMTQLMRHRRSPFDFPGLTMTRTVEQSKAINSIRGSAIIIAGSGMCTGGRVKHHLAANISRRGSTILFVGYQAAGTLGRQIVNGAKQVRIFGQKHRVRARIAQIHGFSAHADRDELMRWLASLNRSPRHLFVVHGEACAANAFADHVRQSTGWPVSVPQYQEVAVLD
ncbi:MAG: MBL fold metallo-hydrolase [Chloroflexota bacterium]|nr:MBL fold metallo-hydrolase [Chloroflexota bacterium]